MYFDFTGLLPDLSPPQAAHPRRNIHQCSAPVDCARLRSDIFRKYNLLVKELLKYDPVADGQGGHDMKWGSGKTKPGGHHQEITELQQGLKNDIKKYKDGCSNNDDNDSGSSGGWAPIPRNIDEAANRPVPKPVIPMVPMPSPVLPKAPEAEPQIPWWKALPRGIPVPTPGINPCFGDPVMCADPESPAFIVPN